MSALPSTDRTHTRQPRQEREVKRVMVTGSRDWTNRDTIHRAFRDHAPAGEVELLHGAAPGADTIAAEIAEELGWRVRTFPADWRVTPDTPTGRIRRRPDGSLYDAAAGIVRNLAMLNEQPHVVLAFQRNGSRGTQHVIDEAHRRGIQVYVWTEASR
jgi:hypothetical protein